MIKKIIASLLIASFFLPTLIMAADAKIKNIKVAYIYNFIRYISWPELNGEDDIFHLCVHEQSQLKEILMSLENKDVKGMPIKILSFTNEDKEFSNCEILILPKLEHEQLKKFIDYSSRHNILTVSDTDGYAKLDVMINLIVLDNKVGFEVNLNKIRTTNLTIRSSLLKLAKIVESENK